MKNKSLPIFLFCFSILFGQQMDKDSIYLNVEKMPINQLATVTVPEPRTITIQVWDKNNVKLVDSEIQKSNQNLNLPNERTNINEKNTINRIM